MKHVADHYNTFWDGREDAFEAYERNLALPSLFKKGEKVLDLGCGNGVVAAYLAKHCEIDIIGADISKVALKTAAKKGIKVKLIDAEAKLPFNDESFDVVFWGDNIEHLFNPLFTAKEIKRILKKDGRVIISCPNMGYWRYRLHYLLKGQLADTEWSGNPPWYWSHIRFFNKSIIKQFIKEAGFKEIKEYIGISTRKLDKPFLKINPELFGMIQIMVIK